MAYHSKYTGAEVDTLLGKVESGEVGGKVTVDSSLSTESENPVMNKVITVELNNKADKGKVTAALNTKADKNETDTKLAELSAEINEVVEKIDNINPTPMISVTYAELVELRDNGELVAGMQYRITDYVTTTAQKNTRSAGHQFDVIVTADNENTLNEVARACKSEFDIEKYKDAFSISWEEKMLYVGTQEYEGKEYHLYESESQDLQMLVDFNQINAHLYEQSDPYPYYCSPSFARGYDGSIWEDWQLGRDYGECIQFKYDTPTYFATSKLEAWQIWYSLDNDIERFAWAAVDAIKVYDAEDDSSLIYKRHKLHDTNLFAWAKVMHSDDVEFEGVYDWDNFDDSDLIFTESENIALGSTLTRQGDISVEVVDRQYGKGVIYRMIDEWNNDCPYDFKNIQFKRFAVTEYDKVPSLVVDNEENYYGYYYGALTLFGDQAIQEATYGEDFVWVYTFALKDLATETWHDYTILNSIGLKTDESVIITCHSNVIKEHRDEYLGEHGRKAIWLNNIVFFNCYADISSPDYYDYYSYCYSNSFGNNCGTNSFGNDCYSNSFGNNCYSNSFGNDCNNNSFGNNCGLNSFGNDCYNNSFGNNCGLNSFGNGCYSNSFGNDYYSNSFGNGCYSNSFGNVCYSNSFGNNCGLNSFGNGCYSNSFGNECYSNSFGNECNNNSFGNNCYSNSFGNDSQGNELRAYYRYITFGEGVQYVILDNDISGDNDSQVQNYRVANGVQGSYIEKINFFVVRGRHPEVIFDVKSDGDYVEICLADSTISKVQ